MKILTISGSTRDQSSNSRLLTALPMHFKHFEFQAFLQLGQLPLFKPELDKSPLPESVLTWRKAISTSDALIFSIPEYIHNMPALVKNALEWITSSGELYHKPVLAITFTPNAPRGEKAMQSLLWSLTALDAKVIGQLPLYQRETSFDKNGKIETLEVIDLLTAALELL